MEEAVRSAVHGVIPVVEAIGALIIVVGVLTSFGAYVLSELRIRPAAGGYEEVRLLLGRFLALGLEFQLASDILGTAVSPSFAEIGRLGAIAGIRTLLNFFLAQDLRRDERARARPGAHGEARADGDGGAHAAGATATPAPAPARRWPR